MAKFRKKPVVINAVQWTGEHACLAEIAHLVKFNEGAIRRLDGALPIKTLEGEMLCNVGDWIIVGIQGEPYPCKPDIFAATYEPAD